MNLPEIAAASGMTKSAAQRFAFTLEVMGYLAKDEFSKRYMLTPRVLELGYRYLLVNRFVERASPYLLELSRKSGESVSIAEPSGVDMVYVGRFPGHHAVPVYMPVGRRLPMYCTSAGRAYLSAISEDEAQAILSRSIRRRYTPTTITEIAALMACVKQSRVDGFSVANGEYYRGDLGIGVAVHDASRRPVATVTIAAPSSRWTLARVVSDLAPLIVETSIKIAASSPDPQELEPFHLGLTEAPGITDPDALRR